MKQKSHNITEEELLANIKKCRSEIRSAHTLIIKSIIILHGVTVLREKMGEAFRLPDKFNGELSLLERRLDQLDSVFRGVQQDEEDADDSAASTKPKRKRK